MSLPTQSKTEFPVYAGNNMAPFVPQPKPKGRCIAINVAMAVSFVFMLACAWGFITTVANTGKCCNQPEFSCRMMGG